MDKIVSKTKLTEEIARLMVEVERKDAALKAIEPFLPNLDDSMAIKHSAHAQAAQLVRAAIKPLESES